MTKIWVDGDGCPVISILVECAKKYQIETTVFCDTAHDMSKYDLPCMIVDKGKDRVDFELLKYIHKNDIVITQDYGLASLALSKHAYVLSVNGLRFDEFNILMLLTQRSEHAKIRKVRKHSTKIKKRTVEDDLKFKEGLIQLIEEVREYDE